MPVTGLPAAAEVALSTLLSSETLSSWKVDGNENQTVVVLRFSKDQPLPYDNAQCRYRRKPPSQIRRDRQRAQEYRKVKVPSTYRSSDTLEPSEVNNPCAYADTAAQFHCETTQSEFPPMTSDLPPIHKCTRPVHCTAADEYPSATTDLPPNRQFEVSETCLEAAEKTASDDQPSAAQDLTDTSSDEDLPPYMRDFVRKVMKMQADAESRAEGLTEESTSERGTGMRSDCDRDNAGVHSSPSRAESEDARAPPGGPMRVRPPATAGDKRWDSGHRDHLPTLTRSQRRQKTRKK